MTEEKKKLLQVVGGGLIIAGAFAIMLPGFVQYLFGLWRIFALIAMILIITITLVFVYHKTIKPKSMMDKNQKSEDRENETSS